MMTSRAIYRGTLRARGMLCAALALGLLAGCDENGKFAFPEIPLPKAKDSADTSAAQASGGKTIERDVEAPEVFSAQEDGLWDGRPSLGGVWVAHPDVDDPERVMIRNESNNKFVVGALFRRERDIPGPKLQISSDAAAALGILAGAPTKLNVVALRREEIAEEPAAEPAPAVDAPAEVSAAPLDPIAAASAAIDNAEPTPPAPAAAAPAPAPKPTPAPAPKKSSLSKPFIQIGIFSVEANAKRTSDQMRSAGLVPTIKRGESGGKPFWRVLVGPANTRGEMRTLLSTIKGVGFTDAYAVTN